MNAFFSHLAMFASSIHFPFSFKFYPAATSTLAKRAPRSLEVAPEADGRFLWTLLVKLQDY